MRLQTILGFVFISLCVPIFIHADAVTASNNNDSLEGIKTIHQGVDPYPNRGEGDKISFKYDQNEIAVEKMDGTIMVQHPGDPKPFALESSLTVGKGDIIMVYDQSWVIFKTHRGDRIGLEGNTIVSVDEY
jgi:hypothetical protein